MGETVRLHGFGRLRAVGLCGEARRHGEGRRLSSCRRSSGSTTISSGSPTASRRTAILAIAPALFDRIQPGITLGYGENEIKVGID